MQLIISMIIILVDDGTNEDFHCSLSQTSFTFFIPGRVFEKGYHGLTIEEGRKIVKVTFK